MIRVVDWRLVLRYRIHTGSHSKLWYTIQISYMLSLHLQLAIYFSEIAICIFSSLTHQKYVNGILIITSKVILPLCSTAEPS